MRTDTTMSRAGGALLAALWIAGALLPGRAVAAPSAAMAEAARRDGNAMYEAFRRGRLAEFAAFTYPAVVEQMGGKQKMVALLEEGLAEMKGQGYRFVSGKVRAPVQMVEAGAQIHALLPLEQILTAPGGELHLTGHLLGISGDGGKRWTFIDTAKLTPQSVREVLPQFNEELRLPRPSEPKFVPKK
jgi:hypothetical protein